MHLGPDGTNTYTQSIGEAIAALWTGATNDAHAPESELLAVVAVWDAERTEIHLLTRSEALADYDAFASDDAWPNHTKPYTREKSGTMTPFLSLDRIGVWLR